MKDKAIQLTSGTNHSSVIALIN